MTAPSPRFEQTAAGLLLASVTLVAFNLATAQVLFGIAALMWVRIVLADATRQALPSFFWPLAAFADRHGLPSACRLILNMNEFVFID